MALTCRVCVSLASLWLAWASFCPSRAAGAVAGDPAVSVTRVPALGDLEDWPLARAARPLEALRRGLPAGVDRTSGQPIEMAGDRVLRFTYCDRFAQAWFAHDAAIEGVSCLAWDASAPGLRIEGRGPERRRVSLTYHFTALYEAKELVTEAQGEIQGGKADFVELTMSTDGREFIHPARALGQPGSNAFHLTSAASQQFDRRGFWIRVAADLAPGGRVALSEFKAACRVKPPGRPEILLTQEPSGRLAYADPLASSRLLHLAEVENPDALQWRRGATFLCGKPDGPVQVTIRQRFVVPCSLRSVAVRIRHAVAEQEGGAMDSLGLSLDGEAVLARREVSGGFAGVTELRFDNVASLADARQFYLHITLASGPGEAGKPSNVLSGIEVEAHAAEPDVRTAAAQGTQPARP